MATSTADPLAGVPVLTGFLATTLSGAVSLQTSADLNGHPISAQLGFTSPPTPASTESEALIQRAKTDVLIAADMANDVGTTPAGYHVASTAEMAAIGLTPDMMTLRGGFMARVYESGEGADARYVVAFRGSVTPDDYATDVLQGVGVRTKDYAAALAIGAAVAHTSADVTFTGYSLGGGLASEAAIASGRPADTFNSSGLSETTLAQAQAVAKSTGSGAADVQTYYVPEEPLTTAQNLLNANAQLSLGNINLGIDGIPDAYGTAHALPYAVPAGTDPIGDNPYLLPVRHGLNWVVAGVAQLS